MKPESSTRSTRPPTPSQCPSSESRQTSPKASRQNSSATDLMGKKRKHNSDSLSAKKGRLKEPSAGEKQVAAPSHFKCPISLELMTDPVFCSDGYTYERAQIEKWITQPNAKSPFTRLPLAILGANVGLRSAIWDQFPVLQKHFIRPIFTYNGEKNTDGLPHGHGERVFPNGTVEDGHFQNGQLVQGSRKLGSGNKEIGTFVEGKLHGTGERSYAIGHKAGQVRTGDFQRGVMVHGTVMLPNGDSYVGDLKDDLFHGQGELRDRGGLYRGTFVEGMPNGQGVKNYSNGATFAGEFQRGIACGEGTVNFSNGDCYTGPVENNEPHGEGTIVYKDGAICRGNFQKGRLEGHGVKHFPNGAKYTGNFHNDSYHGKGTYTYEDGTSLEATFVNNKTEGRGIVTFSFGIKLEAEFHDGKPVGPFSVPQKASNSK